MKTVVLKLVAEPTSYLDPMRPNYVMYRDVILHNPDRADIYRAVYTMEEGYPDHIVSILNVSEE